MNEVKVPLVINKLESKAIFNALALSFDMYVDVICGMVGWFVKSL